VIRSNSRGAEGADVSAKQATKATGKSNYGIRLIG